MGLEADGRVSGPRERMSWKDWAALFAFLIIATGGWGVFRELAEQERIELRNRAAICDLAKGIGVSEPSPCELPNVQEYRDPDVQVGSSASSRASRETQEMLCKIAERLDPSIVMETCPT